MEYDRRRFIQLAGIASAGGLAGCMGNGNGNGNGNSEGNSNPGNNNSNQQDGAQKVSYNWQDATWDSYWYSLYNMSTNIAMSGNGVLFPHNEQQRKAFKKRLPAMLNNSDVDKPPIKNPNLNI
ncbi:MAG: plasmid stabilization protein, partial [Halobacteria archaeon]|nr:plasmid stabilization protein [Halobacteria archaeon]